MSTVRSAAGLRAYKAQTLLDQLVAQAKATGRPATATGYPVTATPKGELTLDGKPVGRLSGAVLLAQRLPA